MLLARRAPLESPLLAELRRSLPSGRVSARSRSARSVWPRSTGSCKHSWGSCFRGRSSRRYTTRPAGIPSTRSRSSGCCGARASPSKPASRFPCRSRCTTSCTGACWLYPPESRDFLLAAAAHAHPTVADHRGGIRSRARRRPDAGSGGPHRRARRRSDPLHAPAARRRRLRDCRSPAADRDPCPARRAPRGSGGARVAAGRVGRAARRVGGGSARRRSTTRAGARGSAAGGAPPRPRSGADTGRPVRGSAAPSGRRRISCTSSLETRLARRRSSETVIAALAPGRQRAQGADAVGACPCVRRARRGGRSVSAGRGRGRG